MLKKLSVGLFAYALIASGNLVGMLDELPLNDGTIKHNNTPPQKSPKKITSPKIDVMPRAPIDDVADELDIASLNPGGGVGDIRRGIKTIVVTPPDEKRAKSEEKRPRVDKENSPDGKAAKKTGSPRKKEQKHPVKSTNNGAAILFDRVDWLHTRVGQEITPQQELIDDVTMLLASTHAQLLLTINIVVRSNLQDDWFRKEEDMQDIPPGISYELHELVENYNHIYALMHQDLAKIDEKTIAPYLERMTESLFVIHQIFMTHFDAYVNTELAKLEARSFGNDESGAETKGAVDLNSELAQLQASQFGERPLMNEELASMALVQVDEDGKTVNIQIPVYRQKTAQKLNEQEEKRLKLLQRIDRMMTGLLSDYFDKKDTTKKSITRQDLMDLVEINTDLLFRNLHRFMGADTWKYPVLTAEQQALFDRAKFFLDDALVVLYNDKQKKQKEQLTWLRTQFKARYPDVAAKDIAAFGAKEFRAALKSLKPSKEQEAWFLYKVLGKNYPDAQALYKTLYSRWFRQAHEYNHFKQVLSPEAFRYMIKELNRFFAGNLKKTALAEIPTLKVRGGLHDDGFLAGSIAYKDVIRKSQRDFVLLPQLPTTDIRKQHLACFVPEFLFVGTPEHIATMMAENDNNLFEDCCMAGNAAGVKRLFDTGLAITDQAIMNAYKSNNPAVRKVICDELSHAERFASYFTILKQASFDELSLFVKRDFDVHLTQDEKDPVTLLGKLVDLLCKKNAQYHAQYVPCIADYEVMLRKEALYFADRIAFLMRQKVKYVPTSQKELATESVERSYEIMIDRLHKVADTSRSLLLHDLSLVGMIFDQRYLAEDFILYEESTSHCFDHAVHIFIQRCLQIDDGKMLEESEFGGTNWYLYVDRFGVEIDKVIARLDDLFSFDVSIIRHPEQPETLLAGVVEYIVRKNCELRDAPEDQLQIMADRYVAIILYLTDKCKLKYLSQLWLKHGIKRESVKESHKSMVGALTHAAEGFTAKKLAYFITHHKAFAERFDITSFNIQMDHLRGR